MKKQVTYEQANELRNLGYEFPQSELVYQISENGDIILNKRSVIAFCCEEVNFIACPDTTDLIDAFLQVRESFCYSIILTKIEKHRPTSSFKENRIEVSVQCMEDFQSFASVELVDNLADALVWLKTKD